MCSSDLPHVSHNSSTSFTRYISPGNAQSSAAMAPSAMLRQKRSTEPSRSLPVLLQIPTLFDQVHTWNCSVLKAVNEKILPIDPKYLLATSCTTAAPLLSLPPLIHSADANGDAFKSNHVKLLSTMFEFVRLLKQYYGLEKKHVYHEQHEQQAFAAAAAMAAVAAATQNDDAQQQQQIGRAHV